MKRSRQFIISLLAFILLSFLPIPQAESSPGPPGLPPQEALDITPVYQQTPVWCWVAVGEMVFRHYGVANINPVGNFQCGIIALLHPACNQNCGNCIVPAGSLTTMNNMLTQYPDFASRVSGRSTRITTQVSRSRLSLEALAAEIDAGRPVVAGISPSGYRANGISEHVALIVGYVGANLIVNDPFPFRAATFAGNPYEAAGGEEVSSGQYRISYSAFVNRLQWRESIYRISCSGAGCGDSDDADDEEDTQPTVRYGRSCQTSVGTCGPFYNQPALPLGSRCYCGTPTGPVYGRVVQP